MQSSRVERVFWYGPLSFTEGQSKHNLSDHLTFLIKATFLKDYNSKHTNTESGV